jgi:hypothetical protein
MKLLEEQEFTRRQRKEAMMERLRKKQRSRGGDSTDDINDEELEAEADKLIRFQVLPPSSDFLL